ncbi:S41 family peptidase [Pedobacter ureilyticus]|uniref:S41 family peptidase n=1 Tax=Pedobacter ureilyticus TaxID=1393051 RepID=A0ABW9J7Q7_9SPHI|nr:S41 family peptidase [Pedobacter helvus]
MNKRYLLILTVGSMLVFGACKKSKVEPTPTPPVVTPPTTGTATRQQLSLDSIFLYAKEIYYWNDKLPTYEAFNPRQYSSLSTDLLNYEKELFEISKYSNPGEYKSTSTAPKFSYIFDKSNKNPTASINAISSVDLEGNGNDLGMRFAIFTYSNDPGYLFYVGAVYQNSPAEKAGVTRGDLIKKINGVSFGANYNSEYNALNTALGSNSMTVEVVKANGATATYNITKSVFKSSPIYKSKIFSSGAKKIGYLAYARFSSAANSETELTNIFNDFATNGVTDLIIDLRYNGGGYVSTAEHLINLIAPSTATGVMFTEYFNATMQAGNAKILANQPLLDAAGKIRYGSNGAMLTYANVNYTTSGNTSSFAKKGSLSNVKDIVFLVSGSTASASELVINSLKPHMTVSLVGRTTYGKPIGFFPITIENKYDVYLSLFETKNSLGQGGYYDGMTPTVTTSELITDANNGIYNAMYDFGDPRDGYTKAALNILAQGVTFTNGVSASRSVNASGKTIMASENVASLELVDRQFKGMVENRFKLKN